MKYTLNVGNIGNIPYTNKKEAIKDYNDYVSQSKSNFGRASGESVTLFKGNTIIEEYQPENKLRSILDFSKCKELVDNAINTNEYVILCPHYSINIASKYEDGEQLQWDLEELSDYLGQYVSVSDYDDLIVDLSENEE